MPRPIRNSQGWNRCGSRGDRFDFVPRAEDINLIVRLLIDIDIRLAALESGSVTVGNTDVSNALSSLANSLNVKTSALANAISQAQTVSVSTR